MHQTLGICGAHYCALDRQNSTLAYVGFLLIAPSPPRRLRDFAEAEILSCF